MNEINKEKINCAHCEGVGHWYVCELCIIEGSCTGHCEDNDDEIEMELDDKENHEI